MAKQDNNHGLFNWSTYFKISMLRNISFNMDYYWMCRKNPIREYKNQSEYSKAQETHRPEEDYGLLQYFAYNYYVPLFLAGPVITFNAFIAQVTYILNNLYQSKSSGDPISINIYSEANCNNAWQSDTIHFRS